MTWDVRLGRSLAFCAHPVAAWPRLDNAGRALLVGAYAVTSYALVLLVLVLG